MKDKAKERAERYLSLKESGQISNCWVEAQTFHAPVPVREHVDFNNLALSPQGQMLEQAILAGILTYPHSAVTLQYLECVSRYSEFYKCRTQHIQPVLEAYVDQR